MPRLIFTHPPPSGRHYDFVLERTGVGRSDANILVIRDATVSRTHCEILVWRDEVIVRDLGSRNGTLVNGRRLRGQQAPMRAGQVVQIGPVKARLDFDSGPDLLDGGTKNLSLQLTSPPQADDSDTVDSITAAHAYVRYLKSRAEHGEAAKPSSVQMILLGQTAADPEDPTVAVPVVFEQPTALGEPNVAHGQGGESCRLRRVFARCGWLWQKHFKHGDSSP